MLKGLIAGAVNLSIAFALGATWPGLWGAQGALVLGFFSDGVSLVFFVLALRRLGTARTGACFSTAPFVGAAASLFLWPQLVTLPLMIGGVLMAIGVWLHATERHEHEHVHEAMEHEHMHVQDEHHQHSHGPTDYPVGGPNEPHSHWHEHEPFLHTHPDYPDIQHRHEDSCAGSGPRGTCGKGSDGGTDSGTRRSVTHDIALAHTEHASDSKGFIVRPTRCLAHSPAVPSSRCPLTPLLQRINGRHFIFRLISSRSVRS